jgi:hypothetical protein
VTSEYQELALRMEAQGVPFTFMPAMIAGMLVELYEMVRAEFPADFCDMQRVLVAKVNRTFEAGSFPFRLDPVN